MSQARLALGLTCHDGPRLPPLSWAHESALSFMWRSFDLVGVTELFDEFVLALTDLVGLQSPAYRMQVVAEHTVAQQAAQRLWTNHSCATLLSGGADGAALPGGALHRLLTKRMAGSQENAANHQRRKGRSSTRGEPGMMECRGYGPCMVPGFLKSQKAQDAKYDEAACNSVSAKDILERLCSRLTMDETLYFSARRMFEERYGGSLATDVARLQILRKEGHVLEQVKCAYCKDGAHSVLEQTSVCRLPLLPQAETAIRAHVTCAHWPNVFSVLKHKNVVHTLRWGASRVACYNATMPSRQAVARLGVSMRQAYGTCRTRGRATLVRIVREMSSPKKIWCVQRSLP